MVVCCVIGCKNRSKYCFFATHVITFHRFPKDPEKQRRWVLATGKPNWSPTTSSRICSDHFKEGYFETKNNVRTLVKAAIPTINIYRFYAHDTKDEIDIPEGREVIVRVYRYLQNEYRQLKEFTGNCCDLSILENVLKRTADATGVSERTVTRILEEENYKEAEVSSDDAAPTKKRRKLKHDKNVSDKGQSDIKIGPETIGPRPTEPTPNEKNEVNPEIEKVFRPTIQFVSSLAHAEPPDAALVSVKIESQDPFYQVTDILDSGCSSLISNVICSTTLTKIKSEPADNNMQSSPSDATHMHSTPDTEH